MRRPLLAALALVVCAAAGAQDAPRRKSGLWEISVTMPQMGAPVMSRQCVDQSTDDMTRQSSQGGQEKCSSKSVRREGSNVIVESVCQVGGSTATSRGVVSGDLNSAYKGEMTTKFAPPMQGMAEIKVNFQARLVGPCAPGQKPGDVAVQGMPGGSGGMSQDEMRRMAEEMQRKHGKQ